MESDSPVKAALSLNRSMPPSQIAQTIEHINQIVSDEDKQDEIVQRINRPFETGTDEEDGQTFLKCEYNKDGDSYRSPFSNKYFPALPEDVQDAFYPTGQLLSLEEKMNSILFDYLKLYFENGIASAYFFETDDSGFGACVGIKNSYEDLS